jgi:hypothetical protein
MTNIEIKDEVQSLYKTIAESKQRLKDLRVICKHEKTEIKNFQYSIGSISKAEICCFCGEVIKMLDFQ